MQRPADEVTPDASAARRNWRRTALRVRSMTRFRLLRRWSAPILTTSDAMQQPEEADAARSLAAYERLGVLGVGGAAVVYLVRHRASRQLYAMKVQSCPMQQPWPRRTFHARKEQYILQMLDHPFVCRLHEAFHDTKRLYLVLEYHPGGSLVDVQSFCGGKLSEQAVKLYASEIVLALEYVHTMGFVYRDLKPQNVLVAKDGHIRLTDFGVAHEGFPVDPSRYYTLDDSMRWASDAVAKKAAPSEDEAPTVTTTTTSTSGEDVISEDELDAQAYQEESDSDELDEWETESPDDKFLTSPHMLGIDDRVRLRSNSFVGTLDYMPPEMIQQVATQSSDVDWWALGCLMYELLYGVSPFRKSDDTSTKQLFRRVLVGKLHFPTFPRISDSCKDLIRRLLNVDTRKRLGHRHGSSEVKAHAFFAEIKWAYHNSEPPIVVRERCPSCLIGQQVPSLSVPPFVDDDATGRDDALWCGWNQDSEHDGGSDDFCTHEGERYERGFQPPSRFQAFVRSQSDRFAAFRLGNTSLSLARCDSVI